MSIAVRQEGRGMETGSRDDDVLLLLLACSGQSLDWQKRRDRVRFQRRYWDLSQWKDAEE